MAVPKSILICGGGTAGWMAANLMQHAWPDCKIRLIESENIGIIGVGEGSTPALKQFFKRLNIADREWMPQCNATYKVGISFPNWSTVKDHESYFHPFFSELDIKPGDPFFYNAKLQKQGIPANAHPDHYFVTAEMARRPAAPISEKYAQIDIDYGYHFDSGLLGEFLKRRAIGLGLEHIVDDIEEIEADVSTGIKAVHTKKVGALVADFYVDCTGFRSLLLQQALEVPFKTYKENLFNDSAVAIATEIDVSNGIPAETRSTALSAGWAWRIPLVNRYGNGYVYSSDYLTSEEAEAELRQHLGAHNADKYPARHLKMKVGRVTEHWKQNCIAIGLSQGFIEPLEATALMLVQYSIEEFIAAQNEGHVTASEFNHKVINMMEGIRDYIVCHYVTNSRNDSQYWRDCRAAKRSENLTKLLNAWDNSDAFEQVLDELDEHLVYIRPSWYVMLMGVGRFAETQNQQAPKDSPVFDFQKARGYCEQLVDDVFPGHNEYLQSIYKERWPN